ncbi:hypothetical protein [Hydrogenimonas sp.]
MRKTVWRVLFALSAALLLNGCGGGGEESASLTSSGTETVRLNGSVNDAPVAFADVKLVLLSSGKELGRLKADDRGRWSYVIEKSLLPADSFIVIYAANPDNGAVIRSAVDTDDVREAVDTYESEETTVSHYTEAAIVLSEVYGGLDQEKFDEIKELIRVENGEPVATGREEIDTLARTIQANFDDAAGSQERLALAIYKYLLEKEVSVTLPDGDGRVSIDLPVEYNEQIVLRDVNLSVPVPVTVEGDSLVFALSPLQIQEDINITVTLELDGESATETLTLYAPGNSKTHYRYFAAAPQSAPAASVKTLMVNGRYYTLRPFSYLNIDENDANPDAIDINGSFRGRDFTLKIADNYIGTKILVRAFEGKTLLDVTSPVAETEMTELASTSVYVGDIVALRLDDFKPIEPTDTSIQMPPAAPEF